MISLEFQFGSPTSAPTRTPRETRVQDIEADDMVYEGQQQGQQRFFEDEVGDTNNYRPTESPMASVPSMASPTFSVSYTSVNHQAQQMQVVPQQAGSFNLAETNNGGALGRVPSFGGGGTVGDAAVGSPRKGKTTFRQTTAVSAAQTIGANATQASFTIGSQVASTVMHRPLMSREFPVPHVPSIGVFQGLLHFFLHDNSYTSAKEPCCDTIDEMTYILLLTEEERQKYNNFYTEDEVTNTIVLAPALLIGFLLAIVIYCDIIVFWAPSVRLYPKGALPWTGGEVFPLEGIMPLVLTFLYIIAVTYANTLMISFTMFERQFMIEPEVIQSLHGREVFLGNKAIGILCDANLPGHIPFVRRSISRKVRWYQREGYDTLPADLYASYINSLASYTCAVEYRASTVATVLNVFAPALIAAAPLLARLWTGGSLWGDGLAETFALVFCGFFLSLVCCYSVLAMLNLFDFTMRFQRYRMKWLTSALPDPVRPVEDAWPTIPFHTMENVLVWHRLRSVILRPPMSLYIWGRRLCEATLIVFVIFIGISIIYNIVRKIPTTFDASTNLTIMLVITLGPLMLHILYTPVRFVFETTEVHQEILSRILLLSLKSYAADRVSGAGANTAAHITEVRSAIKVITRSITTESCPISFLGLPIGPWTLVIVGAFFLGCAILVALRGTSIASKFL